MRLMCVIALSSFLFACATPAPLPVYTATVDYERPAWFDSDLTGSVEGSAFWRTKGGEVRTCAGNEVSLVPVTPYATERMLFIYGNTSGGSVVRNIGSPGSTPVDMDYYNDSINTLCDVAGRFVFEDVPVGSYYVTATVVWQVGYQNQGGPVFKRLDVIENKKTRVVVSP